MKLWENILNQWWRTAAIGLSVSIGIVVLVALLFSLRLTAVAAPRATTWYVHPDGSDGDPGSLLLPFATIQHAIDIATDGDTILVATGVYTENLVITETLTLRGSYAVSGTVWLPPGTVFLLGTEGTIINGSGTISQPVVTFRDGSDGAVLDRFTVTGGKADQGAGILISNTAPVVQNCAVISNTATGEGGGILIEGAGLGFEYWASGCITQFLSAFDALAPSLTFSEWITVYVEGSDVVMSHTNAIYNCCATMVVDFKDQSPLLKLTEREAFVMGPCDCVCPFNISARIPDLAPGDYQVEVWDEPNARLVMSAALTVPGAVIGMIPTESSAAQDKPVIQDCIIANNVGGGSGGGIALTNGASAAIVNSLVISNAGVGLGGLMTGTIVNVTVADNTGRGVQVGGVVAIANSIMWGNGGGDYVCLGDCTLAYSNVGSGDTTGTGNIREDPRFVGGGDYHLQVDSPCIDAGTSVGTPATDIEGTVRDAAPDIGAYEWIGFRIFLPLVLRNS